MSDVATYTVRAEFEGETHSFPCRADQTVLNAAEAAGITLPSSCCSGVCTTCAALISEGSVEQPDAMGVKGELFSSRATACCAWLTRGPISPSRRGKRMRSTKPSSVNTRSEAHQPPTPVSLAR